MDLATSPRGLHVDTIEPVSAAVGQMIARASSNLPNIKAPVDLLALIGASQKDAYLLGHDAQSRRPELVDAILETRLDTTAITNEVERLQGCEYERDELVDAARCVLLVLSLPGVQAVLKAHGTVAQALTATQAVEKLQAAIAECTS